MLAKLGKEAVDIMEKELHMKFASNKAQLLGSSKKSTDAARRLLGVRAGEVVDAASKLGHGYTLKGRPSHVVQATRFSKFKVRDGLLRKYNGWAGRGRRFSMAACCEESSLVVRCRSYQEKG